MAEPEPPGDLHVRFDGQAWVVFAGDDSDPIATYETQRNAWAFAQVRSRITKVDAVLHSETGEVADHVVHARAPERRLFVWLGAAAAFVIVVFLVLSNGDDDTPTQPEAGGRDSVAQGMAAIDEGGFVASDDPVVADYQAQLDALRRTVCPIDEERIADMAVSAREQITSEGHPITLLTVLQEATQLAAQIPEANNVADALGLPTQTQPSDRCALYFTGVIMDST